MCQNIFFSKKHRYYTVNLKHQNGYFWIHLDHLTHYQKNTRIFGVQICQNMDQNIFFFKKHRYYSVNRKHQNGYFWIHLVHLNRKNIYIGVTKSLRCPIAARVGLYTCVTGLSRQPGIPAQAPSRK